MQLDSEVSMRVMDARFLWNSRSGWAMSLNKLYIVAAMSMSSSPMDISDLFKPNVEKMEKRRDVDGLIRVLKDGDFALQ